MNAIPVSLLSPEELAALGATPFEPPKLASKPPPAGDPGLTQPDPQPMQRPEPKPKAKPKPKPIEEPQDAGAPDAEAAEAGSIHPIEPEPKPIEPAADAGAPLASAKPVAQAPDPLALAGAKVSVADPNANVKLLLMNDRIRDLPIGARIGQLVSRLPQWDSFFGPTKLDPIRDIDRLYVAGPQFKVSADVVAVLQYRVSHRAMRAAIDAIVKREPKGEWLDTAVPSARARADRAERVFVLPKGKTLLMVPPQLGGEAVAMAPRLSLPNFSGSAAVAAFVAKPWRALSGLGLPLEVPRSIASVALSVTPTADGGAVLHIDATDESSDSARGHAAVLTTAINAVTQQNVGALGALLFGGQTLSLIEPLELRADGRNIRGDARVTPRQLDRLLGFAEAWVDAMTGGSRRPASPAHGASSPTNAHGSGP